MKNKIVFGCGNLGRDVVSEPEFYSLEDTQPRWTTRRSFQNFSKSSFCCQRVRYFLSFCLVRLVCLCEMGVKFLVVGNDETARKCSHRCRHL